MSERKLIIVTAVAAGLVASCSPYPDPAPQPQPETGPANEEQTMSSEQQQQLQEERRQAAEEARAEMENESASEETAGASGDTGAGNGGSGAATSGGGNQNWEFARPVPGKEGFVFSPYNNKVIDVRDIPSGTLVQDPTYPASEKKYFRVP